MLFDRLSEVRIFSFLGLLLRHVKLTFQKDQDLRSPYPHPLDHLIMISMEGTSQVVSYQNY